MKDSQHFSSLVNFTPPVRETFGDGGGVTDGQTLRALSSSRPVSVSEAFNDLSL